MKKIISFILLLYVCSVSLCQEKIVMKNEGGVYTIPCTVNGLKLRFIFDTGATDVSLSAVEAAFMLKNEYLNEDDFINSEEYILADGSIEENAVINIKELKIGSVIINNVKACVVKNISAPLLLGQSAISKLGKWYVDSGILYIGNNESNFLYKDMSDEECYARAIEYEKNDNIDDAYNLFLKISGNIKYNKEFVKFVAKNKYGKGLDKAAKICLNQCLAGDTAMISIMKEWHNVLKPKNSADKFAFYQTLYNRISKSYAYDLACAYRDTGKISATEYIKYLEEAAKQAKKDTYPSAAELYVWIGELYSKSYDIYNVINRPYSREQSLKYFKKSINLGSASAMYHYGYELLQTDPIDETTKSNAIYWIDKSARLQHYMALDFLIEEYYYGGIVKKNYNKCIEYSNILMNVPSDLYKLQANAYLGFAYYELKNYKKAFDYLSETEKWRKGDYINVNNVYSYLGDCYLFGLGTDKNETKAHEIYLKGYKQEENDYCRWRLAYMYDNGVGVEENRELAFKFYTEGAKKGDVNCQSGLAKCYYFGTKGRYPVYDVSKSVLWGEKAIENGDNYSHLILGWIYSDDKTSYFNMIEAVKHFKIASDNNIGYASYELGEIYELGKGETSKSYKMAEKYYKLAVQQGCEEAQKKLEQFK